MEFIKTYQKFRKLSEGRKKYEYILYTHCDEDYGYLYMVAADISDYHPDMADTGPCSYSTDDFIISEDDDMREKKQEFIDKLVEDSGMTEIEIATKQNPKVNTKDEDDIEWEVEKYFQYEVNDWEEETKSNWIEENLGTDLWGSIYYIETKGPLETDPEEPIFTFPDSDQSDTAFNPTKSFFEKKHLTENPQIIQFVEIKSGKNPEETAQVFLELFKTKPDVVGKIFNSLPNDTKEALVKIAAEKNIDIKAIADIADIGLF